MLTIAATEHLVLALFDGKVDKAGQPLGQHSLRVRDNYLSLCRGKHNNRVPPLMDDILAALLHDVIEDTLLTEKDLKALGFSDYTVGIVNMLTRPKDWTYEYYIGILCKAGTIPELRIKLADNIDNTSLERLGLLTQEQREWAVKRYQPARARLETALAQRLRELPVQEDA